MSTDNPPIPSTATTSPWRAIGILLAVLLVSWYCFPAGVDDWMEDHCRDGAFCSGLAGITEAVDAASRSAGVAAAFGDWREPLRAALGIDSY